MRDFLAQQNIAQQNSHDQKDLVSLYCDMVECMYVAKNNLSLQHEIRYNYSVLPQ